MTQRDELFFISMAARELGMHPQTLRKYERLGLVQPTRTIGSVRVYSRNEIDRLRLIKHLVDDGGHQPGRRAAPARRGRGGPADAPHGVGRDARPAGGAGGAWRGNSST